ncbi:hypothetical protein C2G38_2156931 [Gigaspora rosea]|uniref:histidine kinase n=1 Tax=Gigaspora rosea TaxID=44941 RepID=A0A397W231_9GLOM|nr:hypothetical protein C2G38_2156931 [Gigaspora rosea]
MSQPLTYHGDDTENEQSIIIYNYDWSKTSLGPMDSWEPTIKNALDLCLQSTYPICLYLGSDLITIFNKEVGKSVNEVYMPDYQLSQLKNVMTTGKGIFQKEQCIEGLRNGYKIEVYFDYTFSPIFKSDGSVYGIFNLVQEVTQKVLSVRRFKTLSEFGRWTSEIKSLDSACNIITKVLRDNNADIPYALIYFIEHKLNANCESLIARLIATTFDEDSKKGRHFPDYFPETREIIDLSKEVDNNRETYIEQKRETTIHSFLKCDSWPIHLLIKKGHNVKVILKDDSQAVLLLTKIPLGGDQTLSAVLICGINRMRELDEQYMEYLQLVANQMNTFLLHGKSIEEERERSKILTDLNYQKIMFFQGINHELKTPLTLMLSPLEDVISESSWETPIMSHLQTIRRNSRRLLKLINVLLQFSNIEANQLEANYIETDIAEFTQELVSGFKNMAETLNLDFIIDIPNSSEFNHNMSDKIYLDHDMYETIVFNLCSNAIKHTWNGNIIIRLYLDNKDDKKMIVLEVSDTGVGIPEVALPNIFQRFYRVESQNSRSHEGTGIGLALVKQLITRHGGDITVKSVVNKGTTFKCWFPIGCEHLPTNQIRINNVEKPINNCQELCINRQLYLEECSQWAKNNMPEAQFNRDQLSVDDDWSVGKVSTKEISSPSSTDNFAARKEHQILLIEDNDDMRNYLSVLLKEFDVINAHDGRDAIKILKKTDKLPDLILSDIMLPNMNGYELLDALRSNTKTQLIPVILLSAKADEYSKIKGSNALKHTWNGSIIIRLYLDYKDKKKMLVLEVSDTGVGIPEVALPNIFQRFYRVESQNSRSHEGTGIGLALVKQLITRHGGDITVTSVVNKGTTFKCWFPIGCEHLPTNQIRFNNVEKPINNCQELYINRQLYLEECSQWAKNNMPEAQFNRDQLSIDDDWSVGKVFTKEISSPSSTDNLAARKKHQILLIEDNNDMRNYLSVLLEEFDVINAHDGRDAIKILKKTDKLPDLILSDIMLPNMNGYELLDALRSNTKTQLIPVILLSAKADEYSQIKGLDKGAVDYLIKPFSAQELIIRIRANIELSLIRRKIILQQCKQEEINQLLLSISIELFSSSSINETLHYIAEEIFHRIPCERIIIISNEQDEFKNNKILALFEDSTNPFVEISDIHRSESPTFTNSQEFLNINSGITISLDVYCDDLHKNVSILSVKVLLNNGFWGWIKIYRPSNSIWLDSEIELLQQISNQTSLAITYRSLLEQNNALEIQIKAAEIANNAKGQILANTSHDINFTELRTPLGAIVGMLSSFEGTNLTVDQRGMINIMARASDVVLSIINNILDAAKLEAHKITLVNRTFDLLELFDDTIEMFGEKAGSKKIELIINYDVDKLPRYVKSDPERIKFTEQGEIILTISMPSCEVIDENNVNPTSSQILNKGVLLIELCDTGIGMDPEYIQYAWKSFSRGDMSITRRQDGTGLGLSICKSLIEINGGEINAESQLGKGSKFWFKWNIELLSSMTTIPKFKTPLLSMQFDEQLIYILPHAIRQKRILIIHPVEMMRNVILNYLKTVEKVDAFDTFDKAIRTAKAYKESHDKPAYDIAFIGFNENTEEVVEAALELRGLEMNDNNLVIIFIAFPNNEGNELAKRLIGKVGGSTFIIYTPITWKKLINQFMCMEKNDATYENNISMHNDENILKRLRDYGFHKNGNNSQDIYEYIIGKDFKRKCTSGKDFNGKCILCVDNDSISLENTLQQVSKLGYLTVSSTSGQEAVRLIDSEFKPLNNAYSSSSNLDMEQPIMSGFDVSRLIRAMRPPISNIPIIILTNLLTEEIQNKCIELGINDFLGKPLKIEELEKVLTKLDW